MNEWKTAAADLGSRIPAGIRFYRGRDAVELRLSKRAIGLAGENSRNMQENEAAFEGWAAAVFTRCLARNGTVLLSVESGTDLPEPEADAALHYNRFLYRALRFHRQYPWCELAEPLQSAAEAFERNILFAGADCVSSRPIGKAGLNNTPENRAEHAFAENPELLWNCLALRADDRPTALYEQLPVGLFKRRAAEENAIFPHRKAAIDLWYAQGETISFFELKTRNKMIGAVTELFFYANYLRDMYCRRGPWQPADESGDRGFAVLRQGSFTRVNGILLADEIHPLIDEELIDVLNAGTEKDALRYGLCAYDLKDVSGETK